MTTIDKHGISTSRVIGFASFHLNILTSLLLSTLIGTHSTQAAVAKNADAFVHYQVYTGNKPVTHTQVNQKLYNAFYEYFEKPNGANRIYIEDTIDGQVMGRVIVPDENNVVKSEGQSYAMMIAVQLGKKQVFERLWRFAKAKMQHGNGDYYFSWRTDKWGKVTGGNFDYNPAPDGEEYFAMALMFANNLGWSQPGQKTYAWEANKILDQMISGPNPMIDPNHKLIKFSPFENFTDPSYILPAFTALWSQWAWNNKSIWASVTQKSRQYLVNSAHPYSGLHSEYAHFVPQTLSDGQKWYPAWTSYNNDSQYAAYDSWRTPMNIAMDHQWHNQNYGKDVLRKRLETFERDSITNYQSVYTWWGSQVTQWGPASGLIAMNATAALDTNNYALKKRFLEQLYWMPLPTQSRYYNGLLYTLAFLNLSGNYKIISPQ